MAARPAGPRRRLARVRTSAEFERAKATGRRVRTPHFVLVLAVTSADEAEEGPRLGIVASRRIGNAVCRNRAKRLVREAFRATRDLFHPRLSVIVIVTHPPENMKRDDVIAQWRGAASRIAQRSNEALCEAGDTSDDKAGT